MSYNTPWVAGFAAATCVISTVGVFAAVLSDAPPELITFFGGFALGAFLWSVLGDLIMDRG